MGGGVNWGFGVKFLYDQHLRFFRPALPCYLRVQNFTTPQSGFVELGFQYSPTGAAQPEQTGFTDYPIQPPVEVWSGGKGGARGSDIGLNQARLMFYSRTFYISDTFVVSRMNSQGFTDPYQVWRDPSVIGLFYDSRLHKIQEVDYETVANTRVAWVLNGEFQETAVTVAGS